MQVAMKPGVTGDYGSWFDVGVVSIQLAIACLDYQTGSTGGTISAGDRDGIQVTLSGARVAAAAQ